MHVIQDYVIQRKLHFEAFIKKIVVEVKRQIIDDKTFGMDQKKTGKNLPIRKISHKWISSIRT